MAARIPNTASNKPVNEQTLATNTNVLQPLSTDQTRPASEDDCRVVGDKRDPSHGNEKGVERDDDAKNLYLSRQSAGEQEDREPSHLMEPIQSNQSTTTDKSAESNTSRSNVVEPHRKRTWKERLNPLRKKHVPPVPAEPSISKEYQAGLFSSLTFQWMTPLMSVGYQRPLELNDIWTVNPDRSVAVLAARLREAVKRRKHSSGKSDPLAMAIYDTFKKDIWIGGLCQLTAACMQVLSPFTLKYLIAFVEEAYSARSNGGASPPIGRGVGLVVGITCMQLMQSLCINQYFYRGMLVGGQTRSALIACIFEKAMKLSGRAKAGGKFTSTCEKPLDEIQSKSRERRKNTHPGQKEQTGGSKIREGWNNGRISNLMSTDTSRIDQASVIIHRCWTAPIQILLTMALLCINLTYSPLAGFALICVMMPFLGRAMRSLMVRRKAINVLTDQRIQLTQEIFSSIRFVKFFAWETSFLDRLAKIRRLEIHNITILMSIRNGILAVSVMMPVLASMLTFITYYLSKHVLSAAPIFSSLALFNTLNVPLETLPVAIGRVVDANASAERISEFLAAEELQEDANWDAESENAIIVDHATFVWEANVTQYSEAGKRNKHEKKPPKERFKELKTQSKNGRKGENPTLDLTRSLSAVPPGTSIDEENLPPFQIAGINISVGCKELVAVIGSVGSGKSSFLSALAGDMRKTSGKITFQSSRAFCPQYAWIQNATVRQNVVFGKEFDLKRYNAVIDACALRPDLEMLPSGDQTEIGERGITVSGGQKQRMNIARAIYFDADIVLMDDPLSAVDAHVGKHIMDNAICGLLRDKCRVLATHQLHVLHRVDRIVWMQDGRIHKIATFRELMDGDPSFQKLVEATSNAEKPEEQDHSKDGEVREEKESSNRKPDRRRVAALMQQEERAIGSVSWEIYRNFIKASGSTWNLAPIVIIIVIAQGSSIVTNLWLSWWTSGRFDLATGVYIGIYTSLGVLQSLFMFSFALILTSLSTRASKIMLHRATSSALRAPMSFFDTTPLGRITNRFSKDADTMDNKLTDDLRFFLYIISTIIGVFCLTVVYYYYFVTVLVPLSMAFLFAASYYRASAREIKRYEAVLRSVVFSRFSEAVSGTTTIRAYGVQKQFLKSVTESLDSMNGAYFLTFANQRWLSIRLDAIGLLLIFGIGILIVTSRFRVNSSIGGLVLAYMLSIVQLFQVTVYQFAEIENSMNSTERIHHYGKYLEQEASSRMGEVRPSWPEKGEIVFSNVRMRYRPDLPLVLKGLSIHIQPGEHIGVVGRTGAGKSTIVSTIFRLVELSGGSISIDNLDIAKIGLLDLRSRLSIIPQDPTLFRGTIRSNLDPFDEHQDLKLWNALRQADLVSGEQQSISEKGVGGRGGERIHLDTVVDDEGLNFSLGQRQLLALARALVRNSQVIICDEATSSVDLKTDQRIQKTILKVFKGKTLLCIAHRLNTIVGYV